ncbi:MAG TPA: PAS domain-containing protein [Methanocella sp.]|nr:PAS domain-containing protein [Methanocella sp.]
MRRTDKCIDRRDPAIINSDYIPLPFVELTPEGQAISCNRAFLELLGYQDLGPQAIPLLIDLVPGDWRTEVAQDRPQFRHYCTSLMSREGAKVPVTAYLGRIGDAQGKTCRITACIMDLALSETFEETIIKAGQLDAQAASVLNNMGNPVFATDAAYEIVFVNRQAERFFGKSRGELVGQTLWNVYPVSSQDILYRLFHKAIEAGRKLTFDHYSRRQNIWYEAFVYPRAEGGVVAVLYNVTSRKHYERYIGLAAFTIDKLTDYVIWTTPAGRIRKMNKITIDELKYDKEKMLLSRITDITNINPKKWEEIWKEIAERGSMLLEAKLYRYGGEAIPVDVSISYVRFAGEENGCIIARDATERKRYELEITAAREQAELYLDLMSHDINNMNMVGMGYLEMAIEDSELGEAQRDGLKKALDTFARSSELISSIKRMQSGKAENAAIERINLRDLLNEVMESYSHSAGKDVTIRADPNGTCFVNGNPLLKEVFSNIVNNSIKHSQGPIEIQIRLAKAMIDGKTFCEVAIEDNGPGIPDEQKEHMFDQWKKAMKGMRRGIGLIIVKSLLDDFHGTIRVEDRVPGDHTKGVRFIIRLPALEEENKGPDAGR